MFSVYVTDFFCQILIMSVSHCIALLGYDDDFIKLYDLTTLCSHLVDDTTTNPFTVPVGILLYRVARNMRMHGRQKSNIVRSLLEKCLLLLDAVKHSQVINTTHNNEISLFLVKTTINKQEKLQDN